MQKKHQKSFLELHDNQISPYHFIVVWISLCSESLLVGGWNNPTRKICSSNCTSPQGSGVKINKIFELPPTVDEVIVLDQRSALEKIKKSYLKETPSQNPFRLHGRLGWGSSWKGHLFRKKEKNSRFFGVRKNSGPGNSSRDLFGDVLTYHLERFWWPPTIGDEVWARLESPGELFFLKRGVFLLLVFLGGNWAIEFFRQRIFVWIPIYQPFPQTSNDFVFVAPVYFD